MKKFDLNAALAGEPVVTRSGRKVTEIHEFKTHTSSWPVVAIVASPNGVGDSTRIFVNRVGRETNSVEDSPLDLFMAPKKWTVWENRYLRSVGGMSCGFSNWYSTEDLADAEHARWFNATRIGGKAHPIEIEE